MIIKLGKKYSPIYRMTHKQCRYTETMVVELVSPYTEYVDEHISIP